MKVYVTTKARPFQSEMFMDVYASKKSAEKALRAKFPHMRKSTGAVDAYGDVYSSDKDCTWVLFIHEKEV